MTTKTGMYFWLTEQEPNGALHASIKNVWRIAMRYARNPLGLFGLVVIVVILLTALLVPYLPVQSPFTQDLPAALQPPGTPGHLLGTDELGRDILSRILWGSRITLSIIAIVSVMVGPIGILIGCFSGYYGGWLDVVLMRITELFLSFPSLILALAFVAALGPNLENAIIAIALTQWPPIARLARAETLSLRNKDHISAIRLMGGSSLRIVTQHILPLCVPSVIVRITMNMATIVLTAAGLGFLGLGAQPPTPEWGAMVSTGRRFMIDSWWVVTMPGLAILFVSLSFNLMGDALRDALDPKQE